MALAQRLFEEHYAQCFWYLRRDLKVTPENLELIARGLRNHGGRELCRLAGQLCR
jgi:hypothetical protein